MLCREYGAWVVRGEGLDDEENEFEREATRRGLGAGGRRHGDGQSLDEDLLRKYQGWKTSG